MRTVGTVDLNTYDLGGFECVAIRVKTRVFPGVFAPLSKDYPAGFDVKTAIVVVRMFDVRTCYVFIENSLAIIYPECFVK